MSFSQDDFLQIAWRDLITFAWNYPELRKAFETEHPGLRLHLLPTSSIDALIDIATGAQKSIDEEYMEAFVLWVTKTQWGLDMAPASYQKAIAENTQKVEDRCPHCNKVRRPGWQCCQGGF